MADPLKVILDFIMTSPEAFSPLFMGTGWMPLLFQAYSIIVPSFGSVYSIIGGKDKSVIILSHARLRFATAGIGLVYLACHLILIRLIPVNPDWIMRIVFVVVAYFALTIIPYHLCNMITNLFNRLGDGPFFTDIDEQGDITYNQLSDDFWKPGPFFVRRVVMRYYTNGLFIPLLLFFMSASNTQMQLIAIAFWLASGVGTLVMIAFRDPHFIHILLPYLALAYYASNYSTFLK